MILFLLLLSLSVEYENFLNFEAYYIILPEEKEVFLKLEEDYQRDLFIEEFWKRRDPFPDTYENEFKENYLRRLEEGKESFGFYDQRTRFYALFGVPDEIIEVKCENFVPLFIWKYRRIELIQSSMVLLFYQPYGLGNFKLYEGFDEEKIFSGERRDEICFEKIYLDQAISWTKNALLDGKLQKLLNPPPVNLEDVKDILKRTIKIPKGFEVLKAAFSFSFKESYAGKTSLLGTLLIQENNIKGIELKGEILKNKKLYDYFNIKFFFESLSPPFPASFKLNLFPGEYELRILAQDLEGKRAFKFVEKITVPSLESLIIKEKIENKFEIKVPFLETLQKGITRFEVDAPKDVSKVKFYLDNSFIAQKNNPPFNIEIDLGAIPLPHILEAVGLDKEGNEIVRDLLFLNQGIDVFKVKILSPKGKLIYYKNVLFQAEVIKPEGKKIEKLEVYEGDTLLLEFLSPPFEGDISIPFKQQPILRAVAYLEDGRKAEDTVILNTSSFEETLKISNVTLYLSVLNSTGKPISGLKKEDFDLYEDNIKQEILEFKEAKNLPLNICFLIDTSASMDQYLENTKKAVSLFVEKFLNFKDKYFLVSFNNSPNLLISLTSDKGLLKNSLKYITASGNTNLYDAIIFSLYQFHLSDERSAIILLTDGKDTGSSFTFEDVLNYIKHSRVIIYPIALNVKFTDLKERNLLSRIAEISGGSFFAISSDEINSTYERIIEELKGQYVISYVSNQTTDNFRKIEIKTKKNLIVKTISGYFP